LKLSFTYWSFINKGLSAEAVLESGPVFFGVEVIEVVNQTSENQHNAKLLYDL